MRLPAKSRRSWKGVCTLRGRAVDGTWEHVFTALPTRADAAADLDWGVAVDSTIVRARSGGPHFQAGPTRRPHGDPAACRPGRRPQAQGPQRWPPACVAR
ncbi:hypothetical protein AB0L59_13700 [Streptomyces sp. NPDC052109]|uniref:hypothetical protein n=1 Tax=Streptomyces sp. NPDC052109 TaxID=3155527 RepID=UPI00342722B8